MSEFSTPELPAMGFVETLDDAERKILSSYGEFLPVRPEQELIRQGDPQDSLYMVISGLLHATCDIDGRKVLLSRISSGDTIGEVSIFDPAAASASVVGVDFSQVWRIDRESLESFLSVSPVSAANLVIAIATQLAGRLRETNTKVAMAAQNLPG